MFTHFCNLFLPFPAEHLAEDDSDMMMEPNDFHPSTAIVSASTATDDTPTLHTADTATGASRHEFYPLVDDIDLDEIGVGGSQDEFRPSSLLINDDDYEPQRRHRIIANGPSSQPPQRSLVRHHRKPIYEPPALHTSTPSSPGFLPSFFRDTVPPLGHSRPYYAQPAAAQQPSLPSQRVSIANAVSVRGVGGAGHQQQLTAPLGSQSAGSGPGTASYDQSLLGSGDFGVIRGGTFYQENDPPVRHLESNDFYHYYKNNGHGRPQVAALHASGYGAGADEQFSNFRDFADINAPSDPAYSQFVVVYANKNATEAAAADNAADAMNDAAADSDEQQQASTTRRPPQNIFEQLELLDREPVQRYEVKEAKPLKPWSFKAKLARTKLEKKYEKKVTLGAGPKDHDYEPLMALS